MSDDAESDLLARLRAGGEADAEGQFTVDMGQARRKLGQFRLASPAHWLLPVVAHAVRSDARELWLSFDGGRWHIWHDGRVLSLADLKALLVLDSFAAQPAIAHLRAAVDAWLGMGLEIDVGSGASFLHLAGLESELGAARAPSPGVTICLTRKDVPRFGAALPEREEQLLRDFCAFAPMSIRINGREMEAGRTLSRALTCRALRHLPVPPYRVPRGISVASLHWDGGFEACMAFVPQGGGQTLVVDGLAFDQSDHRYEALGVQCIAWVSQLSVDLSYGSLMQDDNWREVRRKLDQQVVALIHELAPPSDGLHIPCSRPAQIERVFLEQFPDVHPERLGRALFTLYAAKPTLTNEEVARVRELLEDPRLTEVPVETLGELEESVWRAGQQGRGFLQVPLHDALLDRLRARGPSVPLVQALHHATIRHARGELPERAVPYARLARESTETFPEDLELRARALDVEAIALRLTQTLRDAEKLHRQAAELRRDERVALARSEVLIAEVKLAQGHVEEAQSLLERSRMVFARHSRVGDYVEVCMERAHIWWLLGRLPEARAACEKALSVDPGTEAATFRASRKGTLNALSAVGRHFRIFGPLDGVWVSLHIPLVSAWSFTMDEPDLSAQVELLHLFFTDGRHNPDGLVEKFAAMLLSIEGAQGFSPLWIVTARRLVFALRLAERLAEADALLARLRLAVCLWPLAEAGVLWLPDSKEPTYPH